MKRTSFGLDFSRALSCIFLLRQAQFDDMNRPIHSVVD